MKTKLKQAVNAVLAAGLIVLGLGVMEKAEALNNPDTMTVYVTPSGFTYAVSIASPEVQGYDFTTVALAATTISTKAIPVTNTGNVGEYFALVISNTTPDNWAAVATGVPGYDQFKMLGHFVASGAAQPASATFDVNVDTMTSSVNYGTGNFGQAGVTPTTGASTKDLWLKLTMPTTVTSISQQSMTLIVNGQSN